MVLQLLCTEEEGQHADLFPPLATCLQFSEDDVARVTKAHAEREARRGGGGRRLLSSLLGRGAARGPSADEGGDFASAGERAISGRRAAEMQVTMARAADEACIRTLVSELGALEAWLVDQQAEAEAREAARVARLSAVERSKEEEAEQRRVEAADKLYLRNVLKRYMETEDHHTMFPVVAMLLKLTQEEVDDLAAKRAARERERGGVVRRLFFGA